MLCFLTVCIETLNRLCRCQIMHCDARHADTCKSMWSASGLHITVVPACRPQNAGLVLIDLWYSCSCIAAQVWSFVIFIKPTVAKQLCLLACRATYHCTCVQSMLNILYDSIKANASYSLVEQPWAALILKMIWCCCHSLNWYLACCGGMRLSCMLNGTMVSSRVEILAQRQGCHAACSISVKVNGVVNHVAASLYHMNAKGLATAIFAVLLDIVVSICWKQSEPFHEGSWQYHMPCMTVMTIALQYAAAVRQQHIKIKSFCFQRRDASIMDDQ